MESSLVPNCTKSRIQLIFPQNSQIIFVIAFIATFASEILARALSGSVHSILIVGPYDALANGFDAAALDSSVNDENHNRRRREAYDPYDVYYYYPSSLNRVEKYYTQTRFDRRSSDRETALAQNGNNYKYTPLFQYKSTQAKRRKLFVPNLFG